MRDNKALYTGLAAVIIITGLLTGCKLTPDTHTMVNPYQQYTTFMGQDPGVLWGRLADLWFKFSELVVPTEETTATDVTNEIDTSGLTEEDIGDFADLR